MVICVAVAVAAEVAVSVLNGPFFSHNCYKLLRTACSWAHCGNARNTIALEVGLAFPAIPWCFKACGDSGVWKKTFSKGVVNEELIELDRLDGRQVFDKERRIC